MSKRKIWQGHRAPPESGLRGRSENHWSFKEESRARVAALAAAWKRLATKLSMEKRVAERLKYLEGLPRANRKTLAEVPNSFYVGAVSAYHGAEITPQGIARLRGRKMTHDETLCLVAWLIAQARIPWADVVDAVNAIGETE